MLVILKSGSGGWGLRTRSEKRMTGGIAWFRIFPEPRNTGEQCKHSVKSRILSRLGLLLI